MVELPVEFTERMKKTLGEDFEKFEDCYKFGAVRGIRVNTLKISAEDFEKITPVKTDGVVPWEPNGYYIDSDNPGRTVLHAAGLYYVQEPSAMSVAPRLGADKGERVLDLCSAPGGKGTRLAEAMRCEGVLFMNEIDAKRCRALRANVERLGVKNAVTTCASPEALAEIFPAYFDKILVDAPCSGEGMFRKEQNAIPEWSVETVKMCAKRQARILDCAARMLSGDGTMVYSTCTFSDEEDEERVSEFLKKHPDFELILQEKLYPHEIRGEGHYYAVLKKRGGADNKIQPFRPVVTDVNLLKLYRVFEERTLNIKFENIAQFGDNLYSLPKGMPAVFEEMRKRGINCHAGILLGGYSNDRKRFEPSHSLAMCLKLGEAAGLEVDEKTALGYLRGFTFECDVKEKAWYTVNYKGFPVGWCKAGGGVAKNHLPKGLRI